jgi:hypothetical protein
MVSHYLVLQLIWRINDWPGGALPRWAALLYASPVLSRRRCPPRDSPAFEKIVILGVTGVNCLYALLT